MEYLNIFLFLLAFAMVGLTIGLTLESAFADYHKTINLRFVENPVTCVFEAEYNQEWFNENTIYGVYSGIKEWENVMSMATDGDWKTPILIIAAEDHTDKEVHDFKYCDILISFEEYNDQSIVDEFALGYTYFNHSWSAHKYAHIVIFSHSLNSGLNIDLGVIQDGDEIKIEIKPRPLELTDIHHITKHEWGHAVGLLHHYNEDLSDESRSVMSPKFEPFKDYYMQIQPIDVNAIIHMYGEDGWASPNPPYIDKKIESLEWFIPKLVVTDVRVLLQ